ncbi:MAG: FeoA family protein [Smithellaceae bacterium]
MHTTLDQIQPGNACRITKLTYADRLGARLLTMGVYPGVTLRVVRNAPLRDPMEVQFNDVFLSLRRAEARFIEVTPA